MNGNCPNESVEETIAERHGRIYGSVIEIRTILVDYRSSPAAGIMAGLMLCGMAIIPSFINNSETCPA